MNSLYGQKEVLQINDYKLIRGPRPNSWERLLGFYIDINLEEGWFETFHNRIGEESAWCITANCKFLHHPMSDWERPKANDLIELAQHISDFLKRGHVLVHCLHGEDRTGLVIATCRIVLEGWSAEKAKQEMFENGFHKIPYSWLGWPSVLDEVAAIVKGAT